MDDMREAGLYWSGMFRQLKEKIGRCKICEANRVRKDRVGPLALTLREDLKDKTVLMIDVVGPLPETRKGNKYIILSVNLTDMWPVAVALKNVEQSDAMEHVSMRAKDEGLVDEIWSDRGSVIIGEAAKAFYDDLGIKSRTTTSNNHQGADGVEAVVKIMKDA